jgi:threonyl-tRNA synthetase
MPAQAARTECPSVTRVYRSMSRHQKGISMENNESKKLETLRHSAAHLAAQAVIDLYPDTLLTIGPATEEGFFYDVLPTQSLKEEDLARIEERMHYFANQNLPITHEEISKKEARKIFANNPFKMELIEQIPGEMVGISRQGSFIDLCRGGHVSSTSQIKHFKLLGLAGAYWRADKNNAALQRISGTAFFTAQDLERFLKQREEAMLYDHRRLGKQMDLFSFHPEGPGFPFYHPKGKLIINLLIGYLRNLLEKHGYQEISTPIMLSDELWRRSGHYEHYKENMYFCIIDKKSFAIKPMNCPGSILVYSERPHSYRELPMRLSEFGLVHRHELSGVLHGLFRVRAFTIDDAHIYCTPEQIEQEIITLITLTYQVFKKFGFTDISVAVSTRPEKSIGSTELWHIATDALIKALEKEKIPYHIQEGEGAFYGPKIDFSIKDSIGRQWQCGTIQVDFFQPENFDLFYIASDGTKKRPIMIHRAIYGSIERFFGILLEHYKGNLPFWLTPVQIKILTITDAQKPYAQQIAEKLQSHNVRIQLDESSDPISGKIKTAQLERVPWMFVIGKKETADNTITLRHRTGEQETGLTFEQLLEKIKKEQG